MANLNINKVILGGRMTADPELKTTSGGISTCRFTVAVNRPYVQKNADGTNGQPQADFITCIAFRERADRISQYFHKGSSICICGNIQTRNWTDQQNVKHYATEVMVDEFYFVDSKNDAMGSVPGPASASRPAPSYAAPVNNESQASFTPVDPDAELPF